MSVMEFAGYNRLKTPMRMVMAAFMSASLAQSSQNVDVSLLAAPVYEPQAWNDVSYGQLGDFYTKHDKAVERIIERSYARLHKDPAIAFRRNAHTPPEKAFNVIVIGHTYIRQNPSATLPELAGAMAREYELPYIETLSIAVQARDLYKPRGYQQTNNCYAYAVNDRDKSFDAADFQGNPGDRTMGTEKARHVDPYKAKNFAAFVQQTIEGNISDGMIFTGKRMETRAGFYRTALYARPIAHDVHDPVEAMDYHYIRQNRDGTWSHKFGALFVTDLDYGGKIITDPKAASMGAYKFIGYFLVPKGGLDIGPPGEKATKAASRPAFQTPPAPGPAA
jgi:hypothetical protein